MSSRKSKRRSKSGSKSAPARRRFRLTRLLFRLLLIFALVMGLLLAANIWINPPRGFYMKAEASRLGQIKREVVPMSQIAPVMARAVVAAEDANFCNHWGFDVRAIRQALDQGAGRGASTLTQQTVKNIYLWHGRSWLRKALEAMITPLMEGLWSKRRILEVYLNVAEFDTGVFGVEAAAKHYFGVSAKDLNSKQASLLAAVLPDPKGRSASKPSDWVRKRARSIRDGAATIDRDGRASCFED